MKKELQHMNDCIHYSHILFETFVGICHWMACFNYFTAPEVHVIWNVKKNYFYIGFLNFLICIPLD